MRIGLGDRVALGQHRKYTGGAAKTAVGAGGAMGIIMLGDKRVSKVVKCRRKTKLAAIGGRQNRATRGRRGLAPPWY